MADVKMEDRLISLFNVADVVLAGDGRVTWCEFYYKEDDPENGLMVEFDADEDYIYFTHRALARAKKIKPARYRITSKSKEVFEFSFWKMEPLGDE